MGLPTSGNLSVRDIGAEIGLTGTYGLSDCFTNANAGGFDATYGSITDTNVRAFLGYNHLIPAISVVESLPTFSGGGGSSDLFDVYCNTTWEVTSKPSWVSVNNADFDGDDTTITIVVAGSGIPPQPARSGDIVLTTTFGSNEDTVTVTVNQAAST